MSSDTKEEATSALAAVAPPASTRSPGERLSPASATMRAAATSERSGWPRIAAVEPKACARPSKDITRPRLSRSVAGLRQGPTTKLEDELLSATTSVSENLKIGRA